MRISIDLTPLYKRKKTGVEMYAIDLYKALLKTGHQIIPIFHAKNELDNNKDAFVIKASPRLILENIMLTNAIKKIKPDIALFPIFPPPIDVYRHTIIVPTLHDLAYKKFRKTLNTAAKYYLTPKMDWALKHSDAIITISDTIKEEAAPMCHCPIYNCGENISSDYEYADSIGSEEYLKEWKLLPNNYIISVSTIEPRKNFKYLLKVLKPILEQRKQKLVLVGRKGWGKDEELKKLIEEMKEHIIFTGYVNLECLISLYKYAFAFALLSMDEGFGRTPFEAVACGCKKIILSDIKIFHETFENNALFLPLNDVILSQKLLQSKAIPNINNGFKIPFRDIEEKLPIFLKKIQEYTFLKN